MTDAEYRVAQRRIRQAAGKWHSALGLSWWQVNYVYDREGEMRDRTEPAPPGRYVAGTAKTDWQYKLATLTFNVPLLAEMKDEDLERVVLHEQLHILVNEMREDGIDHEERVVSELVSVMKWVEGHQFGKPLKVGKA